MMNAKTHTAKRQVYSSNPHGIGLSITKPILALLIFGFAASLNAKPLTFPPFNIDVAPGWKHRVEKRALESDERGDLISIYRPDGVGLLRIQSWLAPDTVSKAVLRNLTNVEASTQLMWQEWGDLSGYHYSYTENGSFYKQWWLVNERTILFITCNCDADTQQSEIEAIDKMVNSIKMNRS